MDLASFLKNRDIIYTLCAATLASQIILIADLITNNCVIPIANYKRETSVENFGFYVGNAKIETGKFIVAFTRLFIVMLILYAIYRLSY